LCITAGQAVGVPPWWLDEVEILPQNPTSYDVVSVTLSGEWMDSCVPNVSSISVVGNDIYFDAIHDYPPDIMCLAVLSGWELTEPIGPLSVGTYTVYARLVAGDFPGEEYWPVGAVTVTDYQFVLSTESLTVGEGSTATFTVALLDDPSGAIEVTVARSSGDTDLTVASGGSLFFDSDDYWIPQTVTLAAAEDDDYLHGQALIQVSGPGYLPAELVARESDNDAPPVLYVDANAPGSNGGRTWEDAFRKLQDALSMAAVVPEVEEIRLAQGVYKPAEPGGSAGARFSLVSGVAVKGGYAGFGQPDPDARDILSYETILSGDLNGNDGPNFENYGENSYHVVMNTSGGGAALMDGLTITAGRGGGSGSDGGGLFNRGVTELTNCAFTKNTAAYGAGIKNEMGGALRLSNCIFTGNRVSWYGGAIQCWTAGGLYLVNCTFTNNSAGEGGAIYSFKTNCTLDNCLFSGNSARGGDRKEGHGAGFYHRADFPGGTTASLVNCTFSGNRGVAQAGAGIYDSSYLFETLRLTNCILHQNSADGDTSESAQIYASNKPPIVNYSCIEGWTGSLGGVGNIGDDPYFVEGGYWDASNVWFDGNYHLRAGSPCIDAGDNDPVPIGSVDLDGGPRFCDDPFSPDSGNGTPPIIDMGVYEYIYPIDTCWDLAECAGQPFGDATCDGHAALADLFALKATFGSSAPWVDPECCCDFNRDDSVNLTDLYILRGNFGSGTHIPSTLNQNCPP
jgi:predicted outer membrane repeat protein